MEIAVNGLYPVTQSLQNQKQRHTVCTSTQCHQVQLLLAEQVIGSDEISDFIQHRVQVPSGIPLRDDRC